MFLLKILNMERTFIPYTLEDGPVGGQVPGRFKRAGQIEEAPVRGTVPWHEDIWHEVNPES